MRNTRGYTGYRVRLILVDIRYGEPVYKTMSVETTRVQISIGISRSMRERRDYISPRFARREPGSKTGAEGEVTARGGATLTKG